MSLGSSRARHRRARSVRPLAEHFRRPSVVCSVAVVALGASVAVQAGQSPTGAASRAVSASSALSLPMHSGALLPSGAFLPSGALPGTADGTPTFSLATLLHDDPRTQLTVVAAAPETYRPGTSPLDPTRAPSKLFTGELPVNTIVAPAQPVVIGEGGKFGWRTAPDLGTREFHNGSDISAPAGTPVVAAADGTVTAVFWDVWGGNRVEVSHADGLKTTYSHLDDVMVEVGDDLAASQRLGSVGATGIRVTGAHLHFETWVNGAAVDPESFDWITDTGILPATADPYSLSAQAPSDQEAAQLLEQIEAQLARTAVRPMVTAARPTAEAPKAAPKPAATTVVKAAPKPTGAAAPSAKPTPQPRQTGEAGAPQDTAVKTVEIEAAPVLTTTPAPAPKPTLIPAPAPTTAPTAEPVADLVPAPAPIAPSAPISTPTQSPVQPTTAPLTPPAPVAPPTPSPSPSVPAPSPSVPAPAEDQPSEAEILTEAQRTYASPTVDTDGDGIVDREDTDLDGDGIENALDTDLDGDGIENALEAGPEEVWVPAAREQGA